MDRRFIELDKRTFRLITFPLCGINLFLNLFYGYCLTSNRHKLRQPLRLLLTFLVWCVIAFVVHLVVAHQLLAEINCIDKLHHLMWVIVMLITHSSMVSIVSMSFYYYLQIVPSQRALLIWIKRNIKSFIYVTFFLNEIIIVFNASLNFFPMIPDSWVVTANNCTNIELGLVGLRGNSTAVFTFVKVHLLFCMVILGVCNFSMTHYLFRHIKLRSREGFSASGSQGQRRVAVSESLQAALFLICCVLYLVDALIFEYSKEFVFGPFVSLTVRLLYMTGITASLGAGQAIFRQGAVDVWKALTAPCRARV